MPSSEWDKITKVQNDPFTQYAACQGILKYWKKLTKLEFNYYFKEIDYVIYYKKECRNKLQGILSKHPSLIKRYLSLIEKEHKRYVLECEKLKGADLSLLPDEELEELYLKYKEDHYRIMGIISLPFDMEKVLNQNISTLLPKDRNQEVIMQILSAPEKPSSALLERLSFLKIAERVKENRVRKEDIKNILEGHQKEFSWLGMLALRGNPYSLNFYQERLKEELKGNPTEKYTELKKNLEQQERKVKSLLYEIGASKELQSLVKELRRLVLLRTWRLEQISKGSFFSIHLLRIIAQRKGINPEDIIFLLPPEIEKMFRDEKIRKETINERKQVWCINFDGDKIEFFQGEEAREYAKRMEENYVFSEKIKGQCASPGEHTGKVIIINHKKELGKIKSGDILVTEMTTPDFVPAMERAGAIVTDIGGLTCHAAIVAREMGKPCVVGTEKATKILKNGDRIKVNASRGEITILNH